MNVRLYKIKNEQIHQKVQVAQVEDKVWQG